MFMRLLIAVFFVLALAPASAAPISNCMTGSWYDPATSGNGIVLDASKDATVAYIYTFDSGKPLWLFAQKPSIDADYFDLYSVHGSHINAPRTSADVIGKVYIVPVDANTVTFTLRSDWGSEFCSGFGPGAPLCSVSKTLIRLTAPVACSH